jgi:heparan-alpha-glucosaminide N-acetyltransferase
MSHTPADPKPARLVSLDAFRGAIMILMASAGLGASTIAKSYPESPVWRILGFHTDHTEWTGCSFWDLIQPAFMFMVGVALPWSVANRRARGQAFGSMFAHAVWRGALLVLIAVFLTSAWSKQTEWIFPNVLAQIGLGYPFLFLLAFVSPRTQWIAIGSILFLYWLAFALYPLPPADVDWAAVGVPADWSYLDGFAAHWEKNANLAATFDVWFLNLFPRAEPFIFNAGGYQTLNFAPSLATMVFGLCAGRLLKSELSLSGKLARLIVFGLLGLALGWLISRAGLCPLAKRIWTPSWAIYSSGWVALMLAGFVAVVEGLGWKRWAFPLVVVGLNPITFYCLWQLSGGFIKNQIRIHFGQDVFASFGDVWVPALERGSVLLVLWLIVWWMYRRKIFLRV